MYNANTLKTGLIDLVGWRQNVDPNGEQLTSLTTSTSGLHYNDEHPLLTFENIKALAPRFEDIYSNWSSTTTYAADEIVYLSSNQLFYKSLLGTNLDQDPTTEATYWELYSPLTAWIQERTERSIIRSIEAWIDKKFEVKTARNLLERKELFSVTGLLTDTITSADKIVGLSLKPARGRSIKLNIEAIGLQFDTNQTITIKLFDATKPAYIQTVDVVYTGSGGVQWETVDWSVDGRGEYYVVYDQTDITGNAINGVYDYTTTGNGMLENSFMRYVNVSAFELSGVLSTLWDIEDNSYSLTLNYGLNLRLNVQCDYTTFITEQKNLFKTIISKQVAIDMLLELATNSNVRVNRNIVNVDKSQILYEIDGDPRGRPGGLRNQLDNAINSITFDLEGIDKICLPCRKRSVRFKAI